MSREDPILEALITSMLLSALQQKVSVTRYSETAYTLYLSPVAKSFFCSKVVFAGLHVIATDGVTLIKYGKSSVRLSPTGGLYDEQGTAAELYIPPDVAYTMTCITDKAAVHIRIILDPVHRSRFVDHVTRQLRKKYF